MDDLEMEMFRSNNKKKKKLSDQNSFNSVDDG